MPFIDATFRTIPEREHRALAGLSMGGAQALRVGFHHMDQFAYIGAFSPAIDITDTQRRLRRRPPGKSGEGQSAAQASMDGDRPRRFLCTPVKASHETLNSAGIRHEWIESSGAHVWTVWRKYLADFTPRLFQYETGPHGGIGRSLVGSLALGQDHGRSSCELRLHGKCAGRSRCDSQPDWGRSAWRGSLCGHG